MIILFCRDFESICVALFLYYRSWFICWPVKISQKPSFYLSIHLVKQKYNTIQYYILYICIYVLVPGPSTPLSPPMVWSPPPPATPILYTLGTPYIHSIYGLYTIYRDSIHLYTLTTSCSPFLTTYPHHTKGGTKTIFGGRGGVAGTDAYLHIYIYRINIEDYNVNTRNVPSQTLRSACRARLLFTASSTKSRRTTTRTLENYNTFQGTSGR